MNQLTHLAIIMDGNGRWAKKQNKNRTEGHRAGADVVRSVTEYCARHEDIKYLTLYAFSTENWNRPKTEVEFLMNLLDRYLKQELPTLINNNIRFHTIGDLSRFSKKLQRTIEDVKQKTKNNTALTQILALNYGSKDEIVRAINKAIDAGVHVSEESFSNLLDTSGIPDVDLLVRTSGEQRLSNFLLYQLAYAEFYFSEVLWPDFDDVELEKIIQEYKNRTRRFGGI